GSSLTPDATRLESRPRAFVPELALLELPLQSRTNSGLSPGEVITSPRITAEQSGAIAALVPADTLGVAIPVAAEQLGVEPGDRVAIYRAGFETRALLLVPTATVIALNESGIIVAVSPSEVEKILEGLILNDLVPVLLPSSQTMTGPRPTG
ncbi:MAG: hypothetical protein ACC652_00345, partial [Acidimicrobiales bacterium]